MDAVGFSSFLKARGLRFACAESCTGGLLAERLTALAGASEVFWGGVVSYSNDAKVRLLGVDPGAIERHGAVSPEVAQAMAAGVARVAGASLALGITGIAGPDGGTEAKPVGTVWVGLAGAQGPHRGGGAVRLQLEGDRSAIRDQAVLWSLKLATLWWDSGMELDSLIALADNEGKSVVRACSPLPNPPS